MPTGLFAALVGAAVAVAQPLQPGGGVGPPAAADFAPAPSAAEAAFRKRYAEHEPHLIRQYIDNRRIALTSTGYNALEPTGERAGEGEYAAVSRADAFRLTCVVRWPGRPDFVGGELWAGGRLLDLKKDGDRYKATRPAHPPPLRDAGHTSTAAKLFLPLSFDGGTRTSTHFAYQDTLREGLRGAAAGVTAVEDGVLDGRPAVLVFTREPLSGLTAVSYFDPANHLAFLRWVQAGWTDLRTRQTQPGSVVAALTYAPGPEGFPVPAAFRRYFLLPDGREVPAEEVWFTTYERYTPTREDFDLEQQFGVTEGEVAVVQERPGGVRPVTAPVRWWPWYAGGGVVLLVGLVLVVRWRRRAARWWDDLPPATPAVAVSPRRRRRWRVVVGLLVATAATAGVWRWRTAAPPPAYPIKPATHGKDGDEFLAEYNRHLPALLDRYYHNRWVTTEVSEFWREEPNGGGGITETPTDEPGGRTVTTVVTGRDAGRLDATFRRGPGRHAGLIWRDGHMLAVARPPGGPFDFDFRSPVALNRGGFEELMTASRAFLPLAYAGHHRLPYAVEVMSPAGVYAIRPALTVLRTDYRGRPAVRLNNTYLDPANHYAYLGHETEPQNPRFEAAERVVGELTYAPGPEGFPVPAEYRKWAVGADGRRRLREVVRFVEYGRYEPGDIDFDPREQFGVTPPAPSARADAPPAEADAGGAEGWLLAGAGAAVVLLGVVFVRGRRAGRSHFPPPPPAGEGSGP